MLNIAHRGFKSKYPENTKIAFERAIELGADGMEFDVHLSSDKEVVIIHDERLDRTSDGKGLISDFSLKDLKKLNMSNLYKDLDRQEIMTLDEYFDLVKDLDFVSNIELKNSIYSYEGLEERVSSIIKNFKIEDKVLVSSFNHNSVLEFKEKNRNVKCGLLVDCVLYKPWDYMKDLGIEYYHPSAYLIDKDTVVKLKENGILTNVWFGSEHHDFQRIIDLGVNGIITDYPDEIKELLKK